jgi:hypothetical protein
MIDRSALERRLHTKLAGWRELLTRNLAARWTDQVHARETGGVGIGSKGRSRWIG